MVFPSALWAQKLDAVEGAVVLQSEEVYSGRFLVHLKTATVFQMLDSGLLRVHPAQRVKYLFYYDAGLNMNRKFEFRPKSKMDFPTAYEIIFRGFVSLYRESKSIHSEFQQGTDHYYICRLYDQWIPLKKFRARIFPILKSHWGESLQAYIKEQNLNANNLADAIRIMQFCNASFVERNRNASDSSTSDVSGENKSWIQE